MRAVITGATAGIGKAMACQLAQNGWSLVLTGRNQTVLEQLQTGTLPPQAEEQMRALCRLLYPAGLNIDYFPTNFILWGGVLYYVDYECNPYDAQWDFSHWGSRYWADTPELRAWLQEHGQN